MSTFHACYERFSLLLPGRYLAKHSHAIRMPETLFRALPDEATNPAIAVS
ncbi:hypothetical protein [Nitrosospira sp. Nsp1]|nr:hypothetical protein [Nitrosospira sp. Nsp1]SCX44195.1 hypothetical protein SAMN05720354_10568 [Nitrosospira sp. Nsp1]